MKIGLKQVLAVLCGLLLGSAALAAESSPPSNNKTMTAAEFAKLTQSGSALQVLDVRTSLEFRGGHVPASVNVPVGDLDSPETVRSTMAKFDNQKPVYLMCRSGRRSAAAAEKITAQGFSNTIVVEGGMIAYEKAGAKIAK